MSMRAVNSLRYNASYEESSFTDREQSIEQTLEPFDATREDSGNYSVPYPEDEEAFRTGEYIEGPGDVFQDDRDYYDDYDDYRSQSGSEAEDWKFEIAHDEPAGGEPPQSQLYGRTVLAPTISYAHVSTGSTAPQRGPPSINYPPLPTTTHGDYASYSASNQRDPDARARKTPMDFENVLQSAGMRPAAVGEVEGASEKTGSSKKKDARSATKEIAPMPVQEIFGLDDSRENGPASDERPRPPPLTQHEQPAKKKTSVGSLLRSSRSSSGDGQNSDSPPQSPRQKESGKRDRSDKSPQSQSSNSLPSSPDRNPTASPQSNSSRNSKGGRRSSQKGKRNSKDGRSSNRQSRLRDRRSIRERTVSCMCELPEKYVRNLPARYPCGCIIISFVIVFTIIIIGLIVKMPDVDTDLDSLMKTVVNVSVTHDAFVAAVGAIRETYGGRRLQSSIAAYVHSDLYLAYELTENSPYRSVTDFEVMLKISEFEHGLRSLSAWRDECDRADIDFRGFCNPGISMVNVMLPSLQMDTGSVLPSSLLLDGKGQDPLPMRSVLFLLDRYGTREVALRKDFDTGLPDAPLSAFRSAFLFKVPVGTSLDSPSVLSGSVRKVRDRWKDFIRDAVFPYLETSEEQMNGIRVYYSGTSVQGLEVMNTLMDDLLWAIGSGVFVLVYLVLHTRSLFASVLGLMIIVASVPLALVTFLLIASSNSVNIASFLSMFLVVGLGADVVFVYTDFWRDSAYVSKDLGYRALWTYRHAGKASLATTVTTALSFFANIASVLRSLRDFGMFMGLCVVYVWVVISIIYMPVLIFVERCRLSCGTDRVVVFLFACCPNRSRIFQRLVRRINQWKSLIFSSSLLLGLVALIAAILQVESDMATPNIFPKDHNQNRGVEVLNTFSAPAELEYVQKVDSLPPPVEVSVCADWTFADMLPCALFWCEAVPGVQQQENEQCTCYHRFHKTCSSGDTTSTTRFVGLNEGLTNLDVRRIAEDHLRNETSGSIGMTTALVQRDRPPMVIERWETGDSIINGVMDVVYQTLPDSTASQCGWNALCFCSQSICKKQPSWTEGNGVLPARRLESTDPYFSSDWQPLLPRNLQVSRVPAGRRATVDVAFGLLVDPSIPLFGEKDPEDQWTFLETYQPEHPRAQRDMYTMCSTVPPELRVVNSKCWIMDFRQWLLKRDQRFPTPANVFQSSIIQFAQSGMTGGGFSREFLWRENGVLKASFVKFEVDVSKKAPSQEALDYKEMWDRYINNWNRKASPFTRGAFHVSKLWVQAQAQKEVMSSTVTTLAVLAVLSLMSMLTFTKDLVLSVFVVASTTWVVAGLFFFIVVVCKWAMGPIEAIALIVFIGYALTYSLHVAHIYCDKEAVPEIPSNLQADQSAASMSNVRLQRTSFAVRSIGGAILGSALTTAGCTVFLLMCTLTIFLKLGAVVLVVTFLSVIASFVVMPSALLLMGPTQPGCQNPRRMLARGWLKTARRRLHELLGGNGTRSSTPLSSVTVSAASFVEGVMEDEPAAPPPSSNMPNLPGVGGITSAANRIASAAAVVAPQRKSPTASVSPQGSTLTSPSSISPSAPPQRPLRAPPSKPSPLITPQMSIATPLTPQPPPLQTLTYSQYIAGMDDGGLPSHPVEL